MAQSILDFTDLEESFRKNDQMYNLLNTKHKIEDFKSNSYVKCSYLKGLYKVVGFTKDKIIVQSIDIPREFEVFSIASDFLTKTNAQENTVKLLYKR